MNPGATLMTLCLGASIVCGCAARQAPTEQGVEAPVTQAEAVAEAAPASPAAPTGQQSVGWSTTPLAVASEPVAVKEGTIPLVYLVETPGMFRVHDRTEGRDVARAGAAGRSIIRVDGRSGVIFGRETLVAGPLDREHRYVIYRDPTGPNMARQGTFQLRPPPKQQQQQQQQLQERGGQDQEGGPHADR